MASAELAKQVATLSEKIDALAGAAKPEAATKPGLAAMMKDWAPIWAPFTAMVAVMVTILINGGNLSGQLVEVRTQINGVRTELSAQIREVSGKITDVRDRVSRIEGTNGARRP